jgi:MFS family permease
MDPTQRNGGTAGLVSAALLVLLFILFPATGLDPQTMADPEKALPLLGQKRALFAGLGIIGTLAAAVATVFLIGLFGRLRDRAPTRASTLLYLGLLGLGGHALGAMMLWQGGVGLADHAAMDQVGASHAWVALTSTISGIRAFGDAFTGGSLLIAGWAVTETGSLNRTVGWVAVIAGVLSIVGIFVMAQAVMLVTIIFVIIWLAWAGLELRRPAKHKR